MHASLVAVRCLLRHLPLFFKSAPKTPLRVLCIVALDTLHALRHSQPMPRRRIGKVALLLDFQACTNAIWDRKYRRAAETGDLRLRLETAGLKLRIEEYLRRIGELESRRPSIGGDRRGFDDVRAYREAVARLSFAMAIATALGAQSLDDELRAIQSDAHLETLFRIVMQCQIIDDVLDYEEDLSGGLPSFLTATSPLAQSIELTAAAARFYGARGEHATGNAALPIRMTLRAFTSIARLVVLSARLRLGGVARRGVESQVFRPGEKSKLNV